MLEQVNLPLACEPYRASENENGQSELDWKTRALICPACGAGMFLVNGFHRCPKCGYKESCCY